MAALGADVAASHTPRRSLSFSPPFPSFHHGPGDFSCAAGPFAVSLITDVQPPLAEAFWSGFFFESFLSTASPSPLTFRPLGEGDERPGACCCFPPRHGSSFSTSPPCSWESTRPALPFFRAARFPFFCGRPPSGREHAFFHANLFRNLPPFLDQSERVPPLHAALFFSGFSLPSGGTTAFFSFLQIGLYRWCGTHVFFPFSQVLSPFLGSPSIQDRVSSLRMELPSPAVEAVFLPTFFLSF